MHCALIRLHSIEFNTIETIVMKIFGLEKYRDFSVKFKIQ